MTTRPPRADTDGGLAYLAQRLAEASLLRDDLTMQQAINVLRVLCSFETFDAR